MHFRIYAYENSLHFFVDATKKHQLLQDNNNNKCTVAKTERGKLNEKWKLNGIRRSEKNILTIEWFKLRYGIDVKSSDNINHRVFFSRGPHWQAAGSSSGCIVWTLIINLTIVITQRYCSMKLKKIHQNYFPVLARPPKKRKWYACVRLSTVFLIIYLMNKHIFNIFFTRCFFLHVFNFIMSMNSIVINRSSVYSKHGSNQCLFEQQ